MNKLYFILIILFSISSCNESTVDTKILETRILEIIEQSANSYGRACKVIIEKDNKSKDNEELFLVENSDFNHFSIDSLSFKDYFDYKRGIVFCEDKNDVLSEPILTKLEMESNDKEYQLKYQVAKNKKYLSVESIYFNENENQVYLHFTFHQTTGGSSFFIGVYDFIEDELVLKRDLSG